MIKLIKSTFYKEKSTKKKLCDFIKKAEQLSIGKECFDFERSFSAWQGRKYSTMFNSGSSANLALMQVLVNLNKIKPGDKVAFSAITWATNVMPIITMNLKPVPIDIELDTLNISPEKVKQAYYEQKFQCLFITNLLGFSDNIAEIRNFCNKNKVLLIEDNCESLGTEYKNKKLGNFGFASTFSFFVGHHMSTIEGGMVCTDDESIDTMLKMVRSHGWDRHLSRAHQSKLRKKHKIDDFYGKYAFYDIGYNLRPTEIQGFLGSNQLKYLDVVIDKREKNYKKLEKIYTNQDFVKINTNNLSKISNFAFPVVCKTKNLRDKYVKIANEMNIEIRPILAGSINNHVFFKKYIKDKSLLKNAEMVHNLGFYFGNNPELTEKEIKVLVSAFSK